MIWRYLAALAALFVSLPAAAFNDSPTQQPQGVMFYVAIPLDARELKREPLAAGLQIQGKRDYETVRIDTRMFNDNRTFNFFGTGIEAKWIIAGVVAAGAVVAVAAKDKSTSNSQQQQQQQQQQTQQTQQQQQQHPGHFEGDGCACHNQ
jgi:cytochrome c-type biogenesis protein CcmH/NrfG